VAVGAAVFYGAIGLIVPFVGGLVAYLLLTRQVRNLRRDTGRRARQHRSPGLR
jgi:uncharacterized membrane protein YbhN (UPF0104 family)